jgi:hypothetical protein
MTPAPADALVGALELPEIGCALRASGGSAEKACKCCGECESALPAGFSERLHARLDLELLAS